MQIRPEAHIAGVGTAVPYAISTEQFLKVDARMRRANGQTDQTINRLASFCRGTGIHTRHYVHPHWLEDAAPRKGDAIPQGALPRDIFTEHNFIPPYHERMRVFNETCVQLGIAAARRALENWGGDPGSITHILTTCTSGWAEPGVAVGVMQALDLPLDCAKAELNFNGCFCGATCLRLARDIIRSGDHHTVLVVSVEVASTHYDVHATDLSSLVAHSLFADGAAAMVLAPEGRWRYQATGMSLVPESSHLLGLVPPLAAEHQSYRMHLDKRTGQKLGEYFRDGLGSPLLERLHPEGDEGYPALAIHPGGPNILDHVQEAVLARGWPAGAMQSSYDTLQGYGNLGAAAMLFVLANRLADIEEDELITMAFGPGVTVEWAKLSKC